LQRFVEIPPFLVVTEQTGDTLKRSNKFHPWK